MTRYLLASVALFSFLCGAARAAQPNIVLVLTDDIGWGDFKCYNPNSKIPAPNIEKLARAGMRFTDAHTPAALCAPTRYSMLTGNYPWRATSASGVWGYDRATSFRPRQKTIGHLLQEAGYRTAMFGKVNVGGIMEHIGDTEEVDWTKPMKNGPIQWGFEYSYISSGGHALPPFLFFENNRVDGDPSKIVERAKGPGLPDFDTTKIGEILATKAIAFLDDHLAKRNARPFYMHFCTDGSHAPYTPAETLLGTPLKGVSRMTEHTDMVVETDVLLGKLTEALEKRGLLDNTVIVYTSDNGGLPFEREFGHDAVGGLRGCKSFIFEGGHRVPFLVQWPGKIPAGTVRHQVVGTLDVVATFVELAGAKLADDQALDSVSLVPVLLDQRGDDQPVRPTLLMQGSPHSDAFAEVIPAKGQNLGTAYSAFHKAKRATRGKAPRGASSTDSMPHALREGPWKLTFDIGDTPAALYNLTNDLAEQKNLIAEPELAPRVKSMEKLYRELRVAGSTRQASAAKP